MAVDRLPELVVAGVEMAAFAQAIAQGAEHVTVIADAVNSRDLAARGQLPDKLQQQALRKQAVAGASRLLNHLMRNVTSRPLQTADNQLPGIVITGYAEGGAGQQGVVAVAQPQSGFTSRSALPAEEA